MKPFPRIAAAIAQSPNLEANLAEALRATEQLGEELYLIHVDQKEIDEKADILAAVEAAGCDRSQVQVIWEQGDPLEAILRSAQNFKIDLLLAGAQAREGLLRYYRGSLARQLVRKSNCSIWLMRAPQIFSRPIRKMVVNGLNHPKTPATLSKAVESGQALGTESIFVVEEVPPSKELLRAENEAQVQQLDEKRRQLTSQEEQRLQQLLHRIAPEEAPKLIPQVIIGKKGYTIGHFTQSIRADLLVMNSPDTKLGFLDRVFSHDLEYILMELPADLLIVHSTER